jgi:hypothetical protein
MSALRNSLCVTLCLAALSVPVARAQQKDQDQEQPTPPIPAYRSPLASLADNSEDADANPQKLGPDTRSLAGAQDLSLGVLPLTRSYWQPRFDLTGSADSNALASTTQSGWTTYTSLMGGIDLHRISGNSELALNYAGGGTISNDGAIGNAMVHDLQLSDKISFRRSAITLIDQLGYLPETSFGYGGLGGIALPGGGTVGVQNGFLPGQSVLTTRGQRLDNSSLGQVDVFLSSRSTLTFVGGYSLLHYFDNDLLNSGDAIVQAGYNYQMSERNTVAVFYRFSGYRYSNSTQSINDNMFQASYGHRITGKLAFQAAIGPDVAYLQTPISGSSGTSGGAGAAATSPVWKVYWSGSTALTYKLRQTALGLSYSHGLSGGSGVLAGSISDQTSGSVSRQVSRTFSGGFNGGYARNSGLTITTTTPTSQTYDYWFGGVNMSHSFGRTWNLVFNYQVQYQNSSLPFSIGTTSGTSLIRHQVSLGLSWRSRLIPF